MRIEVKCPCCEEQIFIDVHVDYTKIYQPGYPEDCVKMLINNVRVKNVFSFFTVIENL